MYACLRASISSSGLKSPRHHRALTFAQILDAIHAFVIRNDKDDVMRGMICGIYWLSDGIAINIHQFQSLVPKCKSSINGSLQRLGFSLSLGRTASAQAVTNIFPFLRDNSSLLRRWTVRRYGSEMAARLLNDVSIEDHKPLFEISLEGLARHQSAGQPRVELPRIELDSNFEESIPFPETRWDIPRNDLLRSDFDSSPISDALWLENTRGE
jgi:hypothetical protein